MNTVLNILSPLLMAPPSEDGSGGGGSMMLIMILGIFIIMYFFMIRPQIRKAKKQKTFQDALQKGDNIVTAGGIHGKIAKVNEDGRTLLIEVDSGVKLKVEKSVVSSELEPASKK